MASEHFSERLPTTIFHRLLDLIPDLMSLEGAAKSISDGYMDLSVDLLGKTPERIVIALSHYYRHPSGDLIPDPDMEIAIFPAEEKAEALSYQDGYVYRAVDACDGDRRCRRDLNIFLAQWLSNLISQGHHVRAISCTSQINSSGAVVQ